ncbi:MAG: HAD family hydrolase [Oligoflexia bacterium]|nr:HAD family hydrolase [Oligoflexia bacterium]
MKELSRYRHVIWDWNGTLLADAKLSYDIFVEVFEAAGKSCPDYESWREIVHFPISAFYKAFMPEASDDMITRMMEAWARSYEARRSSCGLQPGAERLLFTIQQAGIKQSILSAHTKPELLQAAEEHGVLNCFEEIAALPPGQGGESKAKLGLELIASIEQRYGISKSENVIVGDSSHDAEVAHSLGIDCILVARGIFSRKRLQTLGFPVYDSLLELCQ